MSNGFSQIFSVSACLDVLLCFSSVLFIRLFVPFLFVDVAFAVVVFAVVVFAVAAAVLFV